MKYDYPSIFTGILNTHAPIATKTVQANNHQFMTKALKKAIMKTRFKNVCWKTQNGKI